MHLKTIFNKKSIIIKKKNLKISICFLSYKQGFMQKKSIYTTSFLLTLFYCFLQASILQNFFESPFTEFCSDNQKDNENNNNIDSLCSYYCCLGKSDDLYFEKIFLLNFLKSQRLPFLFLKSLTLTFFLIQKNNSPPKIQLV